MSSTSIVTVNASVVTATAPSILQQTGAFVTQGGTTTAPGTLTLVSQMSDVTALLASSKAIGSITWASSTVTVTTSAAHGWTNGDVIKIVIAGASPIGYNGTFTATVTGANTFTYPLASNPGSATTTGNVTLYAVSQLRQMATTYFAGTGVGGVYVLELGEGSISAGVAALSSFLNDVSGTTQQQYAYLIPREWDANSDFLALVANYTSVSAMTYFYVTTTVANRAVYSGPAYKSVYAEVEAPAIAATEFSLASAFGNALKQRPSSTNKVPSMFCSPSYGTTAYPQRGNQTTFTQLRAANVGWISTGQEGGITSNIIYGPTMSDGQDWNFWYSVDWAQINMAQALANEVINGSASSLNPLYYNQLGINRLQNRVAQVAKNGVSYGLGNGSVVLTKLSTAQFALNYANGDYANKIVINAEPFATYTSENPNDYGVGKYGGLSCIWIPQLGFRSVIFNLQATTLVAG